MAVILRPGKTPDGAEVTLCCASLRPSAPAGRRSTSSCAATAITAARGDALCERNRVGTSSASPATGAARQFAISPRTPRWAGSLARRKVRRYGEFRYAAKSWTSSAASSPASRPCPGRRQPLHRHRSAGAPRCYRERLLPARPGRNLIKAHKLHLASDRTSCTRATANQFRLLIHTAAYWLCTRCAAWRPRPRSGATPSSTPSACLIKVAGRVTEMVTRIKIALPSCYPYQMGFAMLARRASSSRPKPRGGLPDRALPATPNPTDRAPGAALTRVARPAAFPGAHGGCDSGLAFPHVQRTPLRRRGLRAVHRRAHPCLCGPTPQPHRRGAASSIRLPGVPAMGQAYRIWGLVIRHCISPDLRAAGARRVGSRRRADRAASERSRSARPRALSALYAPDRLSLAVRRAERLAGLFADHPDAERVHNLALHRRPSGATATPGSGRRLSRGRRAGAAGADTSAIAAASPAPQRPTLWSEIGKSRSSSSWQRGGRPNVNAELRRPEIAPPGRPCRGRSGALHHRAWLPGDGRCAPGH